MFLLVEHAQDEMMAYQHIKPSSFITAGGTDKRDGMRRLALT